MVEINELIPYLFEGVYVVDKERKIIYWNEGSERITGYKSEEVVNKHCYDNILQHVDDEGQLLCFNGCPLHYTLNTGIVNRANIYLRHKSGYRVPVSVKSIPIYDDDKNVVAAIEIFTEERANNHFEKEYENLKDQLMKDQLTGIYNRRYLNFSINTAIEANKLFEQSFGVLMIDIDNFKKINDTYGHLIGDEILKVIATTMVNSIELPDIMTRYGGEEFMGIIQVSSKKDLEKTANKIRILCSKASVNIKEKLKVSVTVSIGGTMFKEGLSENQLIENADKALYVSKNNGKNKVTIF